MGVASFMSIWWTLVFLSYVKTVIQHPICSKGIIPFAGKVLTPRPGEIKIKRFAFFLRFDEMATDSTTSDSPL